MSFVDTIVCVHKEESWTHPDQALQGEDARDEAAAANDPRAARDRGRDAFSGSLGIESGAAARCECEPGVLLAEALSRRAAGKQHDHATPAG